MVTSALLVGPDLAHDPYATPPILHWRDVRERARNPGAWPVVPDRERPLWNRNRRNGSGRSGSG
ncbi:conserved hypothetical protein [Streptomyces sp. C]|nr:conserved hypothetical protein [Streptomyces sp. C]